MKLLHACPPSCKRLRIDAQTAGAAEERLRALELVDRMVAGGMRRGDALRTVGLARSTYYDWRRAFRRGGVRALKPRCTRPRTARRRRWTDAEPTAATAAPSRRFRRTLRVRPSAPSPSSWPTSSAPARRWAFPCTSCRREGPSGTAASSAPTGPPGSSSGASTTDPSPSPTSPLGSPGTSSSTTTGGLTGRWIAEPRTSTLSRSRMPPDPAGEKFRKVLSRYIAKKYRIVGVPPPNWTKDWTTLFQHLRRYGGQMPDPAVLAPTNNHRRAKGPESFVPFLLPFAGQDRVYREGLIGTQASEKIRTSRFSLVREIQHTDMLEPATRHDPHDLVLNLVRVGRHKVTASISADSCGGKAVPVVLAVVTRIG